MTNAITSSSVKMGDGVGIGVGAALQPNDNHDGHQSQQQNYGRNIENHGFPPLRLYFLLPRYAPIIKQGMAKYPPNLGDTAIIKLPTINPRKAPMTI
jgi:hypothetical protein